MVHVTSLLIPAMMLLPNLLFIAWPPTSMPELKDLKESLLHKTAEGIGRAGVVVLPLFSAVRVEGGFERIAIVLMLLSLGLYVFGWLRYLRGDRQYRLLYAPMLGIPVPMAVFHERFANAAFRPSAGLQPDPGDRAYSGQPESPAFPRQSWANLKKGGNPFRPFESETPA